MGLTLGGAGGIILFMTSGFYYALCGLVAGGLYFLRNWSQGKRCEVFARLDGKIVVITGGNTGIGKETALALSRLGAKVIIGSRNVDKSKQVAQEIQDETGSQVIALELDLASFESVHKFATEILSKHSGDAIHILINNAGVMFIPEERTKDGNEKQIQVNHLGHFLLTKCLMPKLLKAKPARIVNISSLAHTWTSDLNVDDLNLEMEGYGQIKAYAKSKLANILFTKELDRRYKDLEVYAYAVHPGTVATEISTHIENKFPEWFNKTVGEFFKQFFLKTSENGAQTSIHCAIQPDPRLLSGAYFADCRVTQPSKAALNETTQKNLWTKSEDIIGSIEIAAPKTLEENLSEIQETPVIPEKINDSSSDSDEPEIIEEVIKEEQNAKVIQDEILSNPINTRNDIGISDQELVAMSTKEINKLLKKSGIPKERQKELKEERRTLERRTLKDESDSDEPEIIAEYEKITEDVKPDQDTAQAQDSSSSSSSDSESENVEKEIVSEENLMETIESFQKSNLKTVETVVKASLPDQDDVAQEKEIIEAETEQNKEVFGKIVTEETLQHSIETLQHTEIKEANILPDKYDLLKERIEDNLAQDVQ